MPIVELSEMELEIVSSWYYAAAGESKSGLSIPKLEHLRDEYKHEYPKMIEEAQKVMGLLEKLKIKMDGRDEYALTSAGLL